LIFHTGNYFELGCTEMQGYLFSPAIPAAELRALLQSHRAKVVSAA
jgi:EAL domain-containing protein (putative c-di-GMP-specific phosphodiesterase class I)